MADGAHFVGIDAENAVVVGGFIAEFLFNRVGKLIAVCFCRAACHTHAAEGVYAAAQGRVGLKTDNQFIFFVDIAGCIGHKGRDVLGVNV